VSNSIAEGEGKSKTLRRKRKVFAHGENKKINSGRRRGKATRSRRAALRRGATSIEQLVGHLAGR